MAANRLLKALNRNGVEARLLVRDKQTDNPDVVPLGHQRLMKARFVAERLGICLANGLTRQGLFAIDNGSFGADITRTDEFRRADVIHLHWVNQGMLSLKDVGRILETGKRVVWTMHDMWPFTGVCHQASECTRWLTGCGDCPLLKRRGPADLSASTYARKAALYARHRLAFVGCSDWITALARRSPLLKGQRVESIPNPIDTAFYSPCPRAEARERLGLPHEGLVVLFVAYKVTDPNKGIDYLREALARLSAERPDVAARLTLVAVGREAGRLEGTVATAFRGAEYVSDPAVMADYYRAADVLAMPTLMDNLPNTIAEAMACGTPVVGFNVGGLPQMIDHGTNGRLADYKDAASLARHLADVLTAPDYDRLCAEARRKAVAAYSERAVAEAYRRLYEG